MGLKSVVLFMLLMCTVSYCIANNEHEDSLSFMDEVEAFPIEFETDTVSESPLQVKMQGRINLAKWEDIRLSSIEVNLIVDLEAEMKATGQACMELITIINIPFVTLCGKAEIDSTDVNFKWDTDAKSKYFYFKELDQIMQSALNFLKPRLQIGN